MPLSIQALLQNKVTMPDILVPSSLELYRLLHNVFHVCLYLTHQFIETFCSCKKQMRGGSGLLHSACIYRV